MDLVDQPGAANLIKPLGLSMPLGLLPLGIGLVRARRVPMRVGWGIAVAAAAYPISRIGNIAVVAGSERGYAGFGGLRGAAWSAGKSILDFAPCQHTSI